MNKAKTITTAADGARDFTAMQNKHNVFRDSIENIDDFLKTVPIVSAMELARSKASELNFKFKVPAEEFRNPDNAPDAFEKTMLKRLRAQTDINKEKKDIWEIHTVDGQDSLKYFRAVFLTEDCMQCHGDKSLSMKYWGNSKGQDPTGAQMEGMEVGYMKGAFEITMDMEPVYDKVNAASTKIFGVSIGVGLLIIFIALMVSNNISKPVKELQLVAEKISLGELDEEVNFDRGDEIGKLGNSFENLRNKINSIISESKSFSSLIIGGQLNKRIDASNENGAFKELFSGYNSLIDSSNSILDKTSNVMVGNKEGIITYMNANLINMFEENLAEIKKVIPDFDINKLIGTNIDNFHRNPAHNRSVLDNLKTKHEANITLGSLSFRLTITPIYNQGEKSSYVVVWEDYTSDFAFQKELKEIIEKIKAGDLDSRIDVSKLDAGFTEIAQNINLMVEGVAKPLFLTSRYLNDIANGVQLEQLENDFEGEYQKIIENINNVIQTLNDLITEMMNMSEKHDEGFISIYVDESRFKGTYNKLAIGLNTMVKSHIETKKKAINVVNEFGKGNFEADMERLPNEKVFINEALDSVRDNLKIFQFEVNLLIKAATDGKLDVRGETEKFHGGWAELVEGLNNILEAITEPIDESAIVLSKMSEGDFRARMSGEYKGQFDDLKNNVNQVNEALSTLLIQLQQSINTTAATAAELSATSESMASASAEQSAQADEVASAVEEMSHTITDNARSSSKTSEVATKNGESAREGGKIVEETILKMKDIARVVSNSASSVGELGESSKQIGEIVSVIDDIAEQTNMLALNAAIEAARAGEQGRGFAVVADEVRKLAERTSEATKRISNMIGGIQVKTGEAVDAMNKGNKEVELGINLADNAGESLNQILTNAKEVLDMINQIAAASEEQSATSEEISKNVVAISQVTSEFSKKVQDVSISAEDLSKLTTGLDNMISQFKFEDNSSSKSSGLESSEPNSKGRLLN